MTDRRVGMIILACVAIVILFSLLPRREPPAYGTYWDAISARDVPNGSCLMGTADGRYRWGGCGQAND